MEPDSDFFANAPEGARDYVIGAPRSIQQWILEKVRHQRKTKEIERLEAKYRVEIEALKTQLEEASSRQSKRGKPIEVQLVEQQAMLEKLGAENERLKREMEEVKRGAMATKSSPGRYRRDEDQTNTETALGSASAPVPPMSSSESGHSSDTNGNTPPRGVSDPVEADMPNAAFSSPETRSSTSTPLSSPFKSPCDPANRPSKDTRTQTSIITAAMQPEFLGNQDQNNKQAFVTADLGEKLASSIATKLGSKFSGAVHIKDFEPIDPESLKKTINLPQEDYDLVGVEYKDSSLILSSRGFKVPDFSRPPLTDINAKTFIENLIANPPKGHIPYYVGPSLASCQQKFDNLLHPGKLSKLVDLRKESAQPGINNDGHVAGVTLPYWLLGSAFSGTAMHREDANWRSANITLIGEKIWLLIDPDHSNRFEHFVARLVGEKRGSSRCDQWIRHHNLLIGPNQLSEEGIEFRLLTAGPGDMVVTQPGQYHFAVNKTACFAIAINILLDDEELFPDRRVRVCEECGLSFAANENIGNIELLPGASERKSLRHQTRLQKAQQSPSSAPQKVPTRTSKRFAAEATEQPLAKKPKDGPTSDDLADFLFNSDALNRFQELLTAWRARDNVRSFAVGGLAPYEKVAAYYELASHFDSKSVLTALLACVARIQTFKEMNKTKEGRKNLPPGTLEKFHKLSRTKVEFSTFRSHIFNARNFDEILGSLVVFLPFQGNGEISMRQFERGCTPNFRRCLKSRPHFELFQQLGQTFVDSILEGSGYQMTIFECVPTKPELSKLPLECQVQLLKVGYIQENLSETPNWQKPEDWLWDWPLPPDWLPPGCKCMLCKHSNCTCIQRYTTCEGLHVSHYGKKGFGIRVTQFYGRRHVFGELVGNLVKPGSFSDGMGLVFARDDLDGQPVTAQLYTGDKGNIFRFINHRCCSPAVKIEGMRISGKYRMMVVSVRDVTAGEELTANWGCGFVEGTCLCEDCENNQDKEGTVGV
ncbi:uncharacterized protein PpBr36_06794 [Pyricularia pennisetigena]|uniref:uncharacterized protein n=1 Tax=Pyricularia pennisetigena TaxID=1578925 RepID=UPI00114F089F|nr:uncharacterized protein PpBr36_06794 [Pyricularia pennisetigena]TLS23789.1 hypothetical protein PpBr36_06794 [Pyricularia pennisetigena]